MPKYMVGSKQAEHESHRELMEEDNIVIRQAIASIGRERDKLMGEEGGCKPEEHIRGG